MLQPHELAAAMSFPRGYRFAGTRDEQVRQIGNAVAVETAKALAREMIVACLGKDRARSPLRRARAGAGR
jgi:DNA (cytosine-5)-methyltransferase 1